MITTKILADSINPDGVRLTSFLLTYPRFIHAEFMTHRAFSRNAASSRARPIEKVISGVLENPAEFEFWGSNKPGMQAGDQLAEKAITECQMTIGSMRGYAVATAQMLLAAGLHKQNANRYLEVFDHITVLATASEYGLANFFALRADAAAQPEFQVLAYRMLAQYLANKPQQLQWGEWHIPEFVHPDGWKDNPAYYKDGFQEETRLQVATARAARLSFLTFDGKHSMEEDVKLHGRLVGPPFHASPFEHCAQAIKPGINMGRFGESYPWSNFDSIKYVKTPDGKTELISIPCHYGQYRKLFPSENTNELDLSAQLATKPDWIKL